MPRTTVEEKRRTRERIVAEASRRFRTEGIGNVSIVDVMSGVGLTHGGFYKHFASKDELVAEAVAASFADSVSSLTDSALHDFADVVSVFLRPEHRDQADGGCPSAAVGSEMPHQDPTVRAAYDAGIEEMLRVVANVGWPTESPEVSEQRAIAALATMVGGLLLARAIAVGDPPLSQRILDATREHLLDGD